MATVPPPGRPLWAGVATALVLVAALAASARVDAGAQACKAGVRKVAGVSEETFCGPATAKVQVGGKTLSFSQGNCVKTAAYVSVNIGTVIWPRTPATSRTTSASTSARSPAPGRRRPARTAHTAVAPC
jgi:hypothetical protein